MNTYAITIDNRFEKYIAAATHSKARYSAWLEFSDCYDISFGDFQKITTVRRCPPADLDGYDYIRRAYGVNVKHGDRIRLTEHEGNWAGLEGFVVYPGETAQYIHFHLIDSDIIHMVHPLSVEILPNH